MTVARNRGFGILAGGAFALLPVLCGAADALPSPALVQIGSAYVAKQFCSCLFVAARSESSCRAEFKPQIDPARVVIERDGLPERGKVNVTLLTTTAQATYSRRYGCVLAK